MISEIRDDGGIYPLASQKVPSYRSVQYLRRYGWRNNGEATTIELYSQLQDPRRTPTGEQ